MPDSPGKATSERARLELSLVSATLRAFRGFLTGVMTDARSPDQAFTFGMVQGRWTQVVTALVDAVTAIVDDSDYLRDLAARLRNNPVPSQVFDSAHAVLSVGGTDTDLAAALDLDTPNLQILDPATTTSVGASPAVAARQLARTETTAALGYATLRSITEPSKRWVSHHDTYTRPSHLDADGQTVPTNSPFLVGGFVLQHPADPAGPVHETVNCRCVIIGVSVQSEAAQRTVLP